MKYCYLLQESIISDDDGKNRTVYGITATDAEGSFSESYPDIFLNKEKAEQFVDLCNKNELSLCHLSDVIEDILNN